MPDDKPPIEEFSDAEFIKSMREMTSDKLRLISAIRQIRFRLEMSAALTGFVDRGEKTDEDEVVDLIIDLTEKSGGENAGRSDIIKAIRLALGAAWRFSVAAEKGLLQEIDPNSDPDESIHV